MGVFYNIWKPELKRKKFKKCGLSVTTQHKSKSVDFLDVTFDLPNNSNKPHRKANNEPIYINKQFNFPPNTLKQWSKSFAERVSDTWLSKNIFDKSISIYQTAFSQGGFKEV